MKNGIDSAKEYGFDPDRLLRIKQAVLDDTARGLYDGAVFAVGRHGRLILLEAAGHTE